jgi:hypothetical protein
VAYPCTGSECREPLAEPSALREVLLAEWQR